MGRVAWMTDLHLNFLDDQAIVAFCRQIVAMRPDAVVITGDLSEAPRLPGHLALLDHTLEVPIYFVLGNHDYYRGGVGVVRRAMRGLRRRAERLVWLGAADVVPLGEQTALVGHDGWSDGRLGDWAGSRIVLNDYVHIDELAMLSKPALLGVLQDLAADSAEHLTRVLPLALADYEEVFVAVHPPPFAESCLHDGRVAGPDWLPHFSCAAVGEVLLEAARAHPHRSITVLCGHSHARASHRPLPNLHVLTGAAEYGAPELQQLIDVR